MTFCGIFSGIYVKEILKLIQLVKIQLYNLSSLADF